MQLRHFVTARRNPARVATASHTQHNVGRNAQQQDRSTPAREATAPTRTWKELSSSNSAAHHQHTSTSVGGPSTPTRGNQRKQQVARVWRATKRTCEVVKARNGLRGERQNKKKSAPRALTKYAETNNAVDHPCNSRYTHHNVRNVRRDNFASPRKRIGATRGDGHGMRESFIAYLRARNNQMVNRIAVALSAFARRSSRHSGTRS